MYDLENISGFCILVYLKQIKITVHNEANRNFENWHTEGLGEDPDNLGSLINQFSVMPTLVSKSTDANSGTYALKIICDTGTIPPPLGTGIPGDTLHGSVILNIVNARPVNYKSSNNPDTLVFMIFGALPGLTPPALPGNEWFIDDLSFVYNSTGIGETQNKR